MNRDNNNSLWSSAVINISNLGMMIKNLDIFKNEYDIIKILKTADKRMIILVRGKQDGMKKIAKVFMSSSLSDEQIKIYEKFKTRRKNFCQVYDIRKTGIFVVIIMEYLEGLTLKEYFESHKGKNMDKNGYKMIIMELLEGLKFLHDNHIIHGDVKPDNIVVVNDIPVYIDYDLSRYVKGCLEVRKPFGTKLFMAPELVCDQKYCHNSDIWSLGMTLYVCILRLKKEQINDIVSKCCYTTTSYDGNDYYYFSAKLLLNEFVKIDITKCGNTVINLIKAMLIEDNISRPTSKTLSKILCKSKSFAETV